MADGSTVFVHTGVRFYGLKCYARHNSFHQLQSLNRGVDCACALVTIVHMFGVNQQMLRNFRKFAEIFTFLMRRQAEGSASPWFVSNFVVWHKNCKNAFSRTNEIKNIVLVNWSAYEVDRQVSRRCDGAAGTTASVFAAPVLTVPEPGSLALVGLAIAVPMEPRTARSVSQLIDRV